MSVKPKPTLKPDNPTVLCIPSDLAAEIGLNETIVLMQVAFWIRTGDNYRDGHWWTYQSTRDMQQKAFPFWSHTTINRVINSLLKQDLIVEADYNTAAYDRTRWFALNEPGISHLKSIQFTLENQANDPVTNCIDVEQNVTRSNQSVTRSVQNVTRSNQSVTRSVQNVTTIPEIPTEKKQKEKDSALKNAEAVSDTVVSTDTPAPAAEPAQVATSSQPDPTPLEAKSADADGATAPKTRARKSAKSKKDDAGASADTDDDAITHQDKIALIAAWWETLPAKPATVSNPYNRKPWQRQAEALIEAGLTADDVTRFVRAKTAPGQFFHDKHLDWGLVAKDLPVWAAQNPAPPPTQPTRTNQPPSEQLASDGQRRATPEEWAEARKEFDKLVAKWTGANV